MHVWTVEAYAGSRDHLRAERTRGGTGETSIPRVLHAMYDGGLAVVAVGCRLGRVDRALDNDAACVGACDGTGSARRGYAAGSGRSVFVRSLSRMWLHTGRGGLGPYHANGLLEAKVVIGIDIGSSHGARCRLAAIVLIIGQRLRRS